LTRYDPAHKLYKGEVRSRGSSYILQSRSVSDVFQFVNSGIELPTNHPICVCLSVIVLSKFGIVMNKLR
jgi:hypothetical protein